MSELKACPFCGSRAEGPEKEITKGSRNPIWYIHCTMWCVRLSAGTKKSVVGQWNHRATKEVAPAKDALFLQAIQGVRNMYPIGLFPEGNENSDRIGASMARRTCDNIAETYRRLTDSKEGDSGND